MQRKAKLGGYDAGMYDHCLEQRFTNDQNEALFAGTLRNGGTATGAPMGKAKYHYDVDGRRIKNWKPLDPAEALRLQREAEAEAARLAAEAEADAARLAALAEAERLARLRLKQLKDEIARLQDLIKQLMHDAANRAAAQARLDALKKQLADCIANRKKWEDYLASLKDPDDVAAFGWMTFDTWMRRNLCCLLATFVAMCFLLVALLLFFKPCDYEDNYTNHFEIVETFDVQAYPADVMMLLDSSGSLDDTEWQQEKDAASILLTALTTSLINTQGSAAGSVIRAGVAQWSSELKREYIMTDKILGSTGVAQKLVGIDQKSGGTIVSPAFVECYDQIMKYGFSADQANGKTYKLCVIMSDGDYSDGVVTGHTRPNGNTIGDWCLARGMKDNECNVDGLSNKLKEGTDYAQFHIMTIYVGSSSSAKGDFSKLSSCTQAQLAINNCTYYVNAKDLNELKARAKALGTQLAGMVGAERIHKKQERVREQVITTCMGKSDSWLYLVYGALPVLLYILIMFLRYHYRGKKYGHYDPHMFPGSNCEEKISSIVCPRKGEQDAIELKISGDNSRPKSRSLPALMVTNPLAKMRNNLKKGPLSNKQKHQELVNVEGWREHVDPRSGRTYYANAKGETSWTKPAGTDDLGPIIWDKIYDPNTGQNYFHNRDTHDTTWSQPTGQGRVKTLRLERAATTSAYNL